MSFPLRIERRLQQPRWLSVAVPLVSVVVAFGAMTLVLLATDHPPGHTFSASWTPRSSAGARSTRRSSLRRLSLFTGLCAAVAFR